MAMTMPVLCGHLTQRQLPVGENKQTLARMLLSDLQSGQDPDQMTPEAPTSGEEEGEVQSQPFNLAQQATLEYAVRAALTKASSPTLSNPSTSTIHKRHRVSRLPSRSCKQRKRDQTPSSSSSQSSSSDSSPQHLTPSTPSNRSPTTTIIGHSLHYCPDMIKLAAEGVIVFTILHLT